MHMNDNTGRGIGPDEKTGKIMAFSLLAAFSYIVYRKLINTIKPRYTIHDSRYTSK